MTRDVDPNAGVFSPERSARSSRTDEPLRVRVLTRVPDSLPPRVFALAVVEVYAEWAGRCQSVLPLMKRLKLEKDYEPSCFVMLHCMAESHELLEEFRGKSMPHFLFFRNGVKKATVAGANMPAIEKYIVDYTPFGPDADDLEENPMLKRRREEQAEKAEKEAEALQAA